MASQSTITAKFGPGGQATARVIKNMVSYEADLVKKVLRIKTLEGAVQEFDLVGVTTFTTSISGSDYTLTIS